jgi:hypothetical protein
MKWRARNARSHWFIAIPCPGAALGAKFICRPAPDRRFFLNYSVLQYSKGKKIFGGVRTRATVDAKGAFCGNDLLAV